MLASHSHLNLRAHIGRKWIAILVMSAVMACNFGALEAKAADTVVSCPDGGSFIVSDNGQGEVFARDEAFSCGGNVVIPDGVTRIGLFQTQNITRIEIPASVKSIDGFAFANSRNLAEVVIAPNSNLTSIPGYAFYGTKISTFEVPASVTTIGAEAFSQCALLTSMTFESGSQLQSIDVNAFLQAGLTSVSLPSTLITIGNQAFRANRGLTSVDFGVNSQLTTIGEEAFAETALTSVSLGSEVASFNLRAFPSNTSITIASDNPHVAIRDGVLFGGGMTKLISYPSSLTASTYVIPDTVASIEPYAFQNARFTSVSIPNSVIFIGFHSFVSSQLETLTIPDSVTSIGDMAFASNPNLRSVTVANGSALTRIGYRAFQGDMLLTSIDLRPASQLTRIAYLAFANTGLTTVALPSSLEYIEWATFMDSASLTTVTFEANSRLRQIVAEAFVRTSVTTLTLPAPPTRKGHTFLGWSETEQGAAVENASALVIQGSGIVSLWEVQSYPVTFNATGGTSTNPPGVRFQAGGSIESPSEPTQSGFSFKGWSLTDGGAPITFPYQPTVAADLTLYALWTENAPPTPEEPTISDGPTPGSQLATIPVGLTSAEIPATATLPRVTLNFGATSASASATVAPIENPASTSSTPFKVTGTTKIVDIQVTGMTGPVTVCLDGASTDQIFHFTSGLWVELPQRTYVNGQVCGVTESFSPFAAGEAVVPSEPTITSISPVTGPTSGGTTITITGDGFVSGLTVTVGGSACTSVVVVSATSITCVTPSGTLGEKDVVVTNSDSSTVTFAGSFTYAKPFHAVTFKANGGSGKLANSSKNAASALPANRFVRSGYVFNGWNTNAKGTGTAYADRASYSFESDLTLYAQWTVIESGPKLKQFIGIFIGDKSSVTYSMKLAIAGLAKKLPKNANITCVGSTSGSKVTTFDSKLATSRAKTVCAELVKARPDMKYTLKANPSSSIKATANNVWIYQK